MKRSNVTVLQIWSTLTPFVKCFLDGLLGTVQLLRNAQFAENPPPALLP